MPRVERSVRSAFGDVHDLPHVGCWQVRVDEVAVDRVRDVGKTGAGVGVCHADARERARRTPAASDIEAQAAVSLGRSVPYDQLMTLADKDPVARQVVDQAAFSLGRLMTIASAFTMPQKIVLTGEGVGLAVAAPEALDAGRAHDREQHTPAVPLEVVEVSHTHWARGAAIAAMQLRAPSLAAEQLTEAATGVR